MSASNKLIDIFAEYQKNMFREIGTLMGAVLANSVDIDAIEQRILASVDARLKAFESPRIGMKRPRTPSVASEDEEAPAPMAPVKASQTLISNFFEDQSVRTLSDVFSAIAVGGMLPTGAANAAPAISPPANAPEAPAPAPASVAAPAPAPVAAPAPAPVAAPAQQNERQSAPVAAPAPAPAPVAPAPAPTPASSEDEEEEESGSESDDEAAEDEDEDEDDEEESLTEITYKGKKYYMDADCNIYDVDADGELIEDPVGRYDEKTRRILMNN